MNISSRINLAALKHTFTKRKLQSGEEVECLVIPIDLNHLFKSEKGNVYLNTIGFDVKTPTDHSTHIIKQSFKKEFLDSLTEDQKNAFPILGNHLAYGSVPNENRVEMEAVEQDDDLPF